MRTKVNPALVKRFTEKKLRKFMEQSGYVKARYCPVDTVSCLPEDCIPYGKGVYVKQMHEGEPLMLTIMIHWESEGYEVPITDLAVSR